MAIEDPDKVKHARHTATEQSAPHDCNRSSSKASKTKKSRGEPRQEEVELLGAKAQKERRKKRSGIRCKHSKHTALDIGEADGPPASKKGSVREQLLFGCAIVLLLALGYFHFFVQNSNHSEPLQRLATPTSAGSPSPVGSAPSKDLAWYEMPMTGAISGGAFAPFASSVTTASPPSPAPATSGGDDSIANLLRAQGLQGLLLGAKTQAKGAAARGGGAAESRADEPQQDSDVG